MWTEQRAFEPGADYTVEYARATLALALALAGSRQQAHI